MPIDLLAQPAQSTGPQIDLTGSAPTKSTVTAELQTERFSYATEGKVPPQQIRDSVLLGYEDILREQVYFDTAMADRTAKNKTIQDVSNTAAMEGRGLNDDEIKYVQELATSSIPRTKETILESLYAKRFNADMIAQDKELQEFEAAEPEAAKVVFDATEDYTTKQQIAMKIMEEQQDRFDAAGFGTQAWDFGEQLIPGLSWLRTQDRINGTNNEGQFLSGSNIESQIQSLYFQSPEDFETNLRAAIEELSAENVHDAALLAQAAVSFASSDAVWNNVFASLDALDVATLGGGVALSAVVKARSAVRAAGHGTSVARQVAQGNIPAASRSAVATRIQSGQVAPLSPASPAVAAGNTRPQKQIDTIINAYPGMLDPNAFFRNAGSLTSTRQQRLMTEVSRSADFLVSTLTDVAHVQRVTEPQALAKAFDAAEQRFRVTNHRLDQSIVDVVPVNEAADVYGGVDHVKVLIGTKEATGFPTESNAKNFAKNIYRLPDDSYEIENFQGNWFISQTQNVDETALDVSLARIQTENAAPQTFMNQWLWGLRSADDVLSPEHNAWRKTATYGANAVVERMQASMKNLSMLGKNESERLRSVMQEAMYKTRPVVQPDGSIKQVAGVFYEDVGAFESAYLTKHKIMPTDTELAAYFEFRNIMNWDFLMKNLGVYRDKARLGIEQYSTNVSVPVEGTKLFTQKATPFFEGRVVSELPSQSTGTFTVAWVNPKTGKPRFGVYNQLFPGMRDELKEAIENGFKIIQVADPKSKDVRDIFGAKGEPVQFMVVRDTKQKPLSMNQVPYNEGGHWMYPQTGGYIKQSQVHMGRGRRIYDGDTTAFYGQSHGMLAGFADKFNQARAMVKANDPNLDGFVRNNLPYSGAAEFQKLFRDTNNPDGPFNLDTPFVVTGHGQSARDVARLEDIFQEEIFDAGGDANSLSSHITSGWTQERSERLMSVDTVGTQANPQYKLSPAATIDPMESLAISATQMAKGRFYDDYKHRAVEDWVSQFADIIDAPLASVRADPMTYLKQGKWREGADNSKLAAAKANRRAILSILGQDNDFHKAWKWTRQKMVDGVYQRMGKKSASVIDPILWNDKTDPAVIMRSSVFHAKLGMFNPAQLMLQSVSTTMALAIDGSPLRAARAPLAYWMMRTRGLSAVNPKAQGAITKAAAKAFGMDPQYLDEMYDAWMRSGMNVIEGEYGPLDDYLNPRDFMSKGTGAQALDMGTFFFKEGNNVHRGTSFSLSFMKWRDENPTKALDNAALKQITNRADLYYINMSRASNAPWQTGGKWWQQGTAVIGQFFGFQARLTELMLGNRLSPLEKGRLFTMNSLLWGVPIGGAGTVIGAFWPAGESIKEHMIANNIEGDTGVAGKIITDGIVDMVAEYLVGEDMNMAERMGPGGLSFIKDFVEGNYGEMFGASPNFLGQAMALAEPFKMATAGVFFGGPQYDLGIDDFKAVFREVSSFSQAERAYVAFTAGDWLNKKDAIIGEDVVEKGDARIAIAIALGLTPQDISDMYLRYQDNASQSEAKRKITDLALREFQRGIKAAVNGDEENTLFFYKRAAALMQSAEFTPLESSGVWRRAMQQNESMMDRVDKEFLMNDPTERMDWYQKRWEERYTSGY